MPTYEYRCLECNQEFEFVQSITESALSTCILCQKGKVQRLISKNVGISFKGSGFYATDSSSKSTTTTSSSKPKSDASSTATSTAAKSAPSDCASCAKDCSSKTA